MRCCGRRTAGVGSLLAGSLSIDEEVAEGSEHDGDRDPLVQPQRPDCVRRVDPEPLDSDTSGEVADEVEGSHRSRGGSMAIQLSSVACLPPSTQPIGFDAGARTA